MSQFRIKQIDTGIPDDWVFRIDDDGAVPGDDIVAQDPNELAQAITDTQTEILKSGTYAPGVLINATEGVLSRIKTIEDTVGSTSLQDAYDNGRFISVQPGLPLSLGALGEIVLDSSGNLTINANTFKITDGSNDMLLSETGIVSSSSDLTFGTLSSTNDTTLTSDRDLFLKDENLILNITLSETGQTALSTTSQSLVGAINEISGGFTGTDFQQIYNQSSPAEVTTTFAGGPIRFINGSGNINTPALIIEGGISTVDFIDADKITVGPGAAVNATIESDGRIHTLNNLETSTKVISPRLENTSGDIIFQDSRVTLPLTDTGDTALNTTTQTIVGALNEIDSLSNANATNIAVLDLEHDLVTGNHEIINTQAGAGQDATSRLNIKNSGGTTVISMTAEGEITAQDMTLDTYDVNSELAANVAHRNDDGTSHSAVATHLAAGNPHDNVSGFGILSDTSLTGDVTIEAGTGMTITRTGQNIEFSALSGTTLQGVYDTQGNGFLDLDTNTSKNLTFRDSNSLTLMALTETAVEIYKQLDLANVGATINAVSDLTVQSADLMSLESTSGDIDLDTPNAGSTVVIDGIDFNDRSNTHTIDSSLSQNIVGAINDVVEQTYVMSVNNTGATVLKGTAVSIQPDGGFWIPSPNLSPSVLTLEQPLNGDLLWECFGIADEDIAPGVEGRIKTQGIIEANVGAIDGVTNFGAGDILYIARRGYSEIEVEASGPIANNDTITLDTAGATKVYTALTSGADIDLGQFNISNNADANLRADENRNNLIEVLNNPVYHAVANAFYISASAAGDVAKARAVVTGVGSAGDTYIITSPAGVPGNTITLTAVANGTTPAYLEYELGLTAEGTARNLADAINRTSRFDGVDPFTAGAGHQCRADAYSTEIELRWIAAGKTGNNIGLSTTSAAITTPANLSGGTAKIWVQRSERNANGILCSGSNTAGMSCADFTDDEGLSQYINHLRYNLGDRNYEEDDRRIEVGRVLSFDDPVTTILISPRKSIRNRKLIKGIYNDTDY